MRANSRNIVFTMANDAVYPHFTCLARSVMRFSGDFSFKVIPFDDKTSRLRDYCRENNIEIVSGDLEAFDELGIRHGAWRHGPGMYRKFRIFSEDADRVLFLDADSTLFMNPQAIFEAFEASPYDIVFQHPTGRPRNYQHQALDSVTARLGIEKNGYNNGFVLSRPGTIPFAVADALRPRARRRLIGRANEQALMSYLTAMLGLHVATIEDLKPNWTFGISNNTLFFDDGILRARGKEDREVIFVHWFTNKWGDEQFFRISGAFTAPDWQLSQIKLNRHLRQGEFEQARDALDEMRHLGCDDKNKLELCERQIYLASAQKEEVIEQARSWLSQPQSRELTTLIIQKLFELECHEMIIEHFDGRQEEVLDMQLQSLFARALSKTGHIDRALEIGSQVHSAHPYAYQTNRLWIDLCADAGRHEERAAFLREYCEYNPDDEWAMAELAKLPEIEGSNADAGILQLQAQLDQAHIALAEAKSRLGNIEKKDRSLKPSPKKLKRNYAWRIASKFVR